MIGHIDHTEWLYIALVLAVGAERLAELAVAKAHLKWALRRGGVEYGAGHYPVMVALHLALLAGCLAEVLLDDRPFLPWLGWPMVALVVAGQALRWWCIATLGRRWTTRVVVIPGLPPITSGPYRVFRHPNYLAVVIEGVALPLVHTAWLTALLFTVANGLLLSVRIQTENAALDTAYPPARPQDRSR